MKPRPNLPKPSCWPPLTNRNDIAESLYYTRAIDPIGNKIHQIAAIAFCVTLGLTTAGNGVAFAVLAIVAAVRTPFTWRCYNPLLRMPAIWVTTLFACWYALSIVWSNNPSHGGDELGTLRVFALPWMLWPVIDEIIWYIGGFLAGVVAQNIMQAMQFFGIAEYGHGASGRLGGWVHPIHTGVFCAAAVCWHLSATLTARNVRGKCISIALMIAAAAGLAATGSRGPWLGAAAAIPITGLVVMLRRSKSRKPAAIILVALIACAVGGILLSPKFVDERAGGAWREYRAAVEKQEYWTSAGSRIGFWKWAIEIWHTSPIVGQGAGSYRTELEKIPDYQAAIDRAKQATLDEMTDANGEIIIEPGETVDDARERVERLGERRVELYLDHQHAHSAYLHTLAGTGAIGLVLFLAILLIIAWQVWRDPKTHPYVDGTIGVFIVWIIGAQFDSYNLAGDLLGLLILLMTFTLPKRDAALMGPDKNSKSMTPS